jgi:predicted methyltransferase MtxX (methanogen marker protein 4)
MIQIIILLVLLIPILAIVLDSQLGRALAARVENRPLSRGDETTQDRIVLLESEVERLGSELSRLEEESRFLHKLLTERVDGGVKGSLGDGSLRDDLRDASTEGQDHQGD